jgi:hypothetical protein
MAAITTWSTLWHYCSIADGKVPRGGGLLRIWCTVTIVAPATAAGGGGTAALAEC